MVKALLASVVASLAFASGASAYQFSFATPIANQAAIERAISFQVNRQVARYWPVDPVSFVPTGGIPIIVAPPGPVSQLCALNDVDGCHSADWVAVSKWQETGDLTSSIDHEVIEAEVNRLNDPLLPEVCDPVAWRSYRGLGGVRLSDFVYPTWYAHSASMPLDRMGALTAPEPTS